MSTEKKVELISSVKDEYGLAPALRALDLPRATWNYHEIRYHTKRSMPMFVLFWKAYYGIIHPTAFPV